MLLLLFMIIMTRASYYTHTTYVYVRSQTSLPLTYPPSLSQKQQSLLLGHHCNFLK